METEQHTAPCSRCPFARASKPGDLGASPPEKYIGQANGLFLLPCISLCTDRQSSLQVGLPPHAGQCAGVAILRANVGKTQQAPALRLPPDTEKVFASYAEFLAHHNKWSLEAATAYLHLLTPAEMTDVAKVVAANKLLWGDAIVERVWRKES